MEWVGSPSDGGEALQKIRQIEPDIALIDIDMPHLTGLQVAEKLLAEGILTRFIVFTLIRMNGFFIMLRKLESWATC